MTGKGLGNFSLIFSICILCESTITINCEGRIEDGLYTWLLLFNHNQFVGVVVCSLAPFHF